MSKSQIPWSDGNEVLLATLEEIRLPERLVGSMKRDHVRLVGELVQLTQPEVLSKRGLGMKSLQLSKTILDRLGLSIGMELDGWDSDRANEARHEMGQELRKLLFDRADAEWSEHDSLERELHSLLLETSHERNAEMLSRLFGFNERGPQTLESTGRHYGLTRERVRQIAAKAQSRIASIWRPTKYLFAARDLLNSGLLRPFSALEFSEAAKEAGLTKVAFHVEGVIRALDLIGVPNTVERFQVNGIKLYGDSSDRTALEALIIQIRRDTSARGCTDIEHLIRTADQIVGGPDEVRRLLSNFDEITWLDEERTWLMSTAVSRNRLVNVTSGIFSVIPSLDIDSLRESLHRPRRIVSVPPKPVLAAFLEATGIAKVTDGRALALPGAAEGGLGLNDTAFVKAFRELGSPVIREKLEECCVGRLGVNVRSFYVNLSYSPLVVKVAPGVFSLLGSSVDPDQVERLKSHVKRSWYRKAG